jgi:hypothetical protein
MGRDADMHETPLGKELPERCGAGVAEDGVHAAGEHRRHPSALLAEARVPDGVNTTMNAVQALRAHASQAAALVDAGAFQLRDRNDSVLVCRDPGNEGVRCRVGNFPSHVGG